MRIISLLMLMLVTKFSFAQNGLEAIIVEKYYVSDEADAKVTEGGYLKPGSVT